MHTVRACQRQEGRSPGLVAVSEEFAPAPTLELHHVITSQGWIAWIFTLSLYQFIRQYYLHTLYFLFTRLLFGINSAGSLV